MQKLKLENLQTLKDAAYKVYILICYRRFPHFHCFVLIILLLLTFKNQLQENISHDTDNTNKLKSQIQKLDKEIAEVQMSISNHDTTIKELRRLHEEVRFLNSKRSTLFALQEQQYAKLAEDVEGVDTLASCTIIM